MPEAKHEVVWIDTSDLVVRKETEKAVALYNAADPPKLVYLPKSVLVFYDDGRVSVPMWLAEEKGLKQQ